MKEKRTEETKDGKKIVRIVQLFKLEDGSTVRRETSEHTRLQVARDR